jgi:cellobiose phosphorylase
MVTGVGADRDACSALIDKYRDRRLADRVFDLAWTHSQVVRRQINASQADARLYERLGWVRVGVIPDYALLPRGGLCATTVYYRRLGE